jgi:tetratricopeptide (TPR) repeat protein
MELARQLEQAAKLQQSGKLAEAEAIYRAILQAEPNNAWAIQFVGILQHQRGNSAAGIELVRKAIEIDPNIPSFYSNLGVLLNDYGKLEEAAAVYRKALAMTPDDAQVHWNYAINRLAAGDFATGWEEFEWRLRSPQHKLNRGFPQAQWDGSDLAGRTILLHTEGGFGDALQFIRYVPMVAARVGTILLECQAELFRLFQPFPWVSAVFSPPCMLPPFDVQIPLQSLPRIFQTSLANIPANIPYLFAPAGESEKWRERLSGERRKKIGLAWAGSSGGRRSSTLDIFAPLAGISDVQFYSLQKGPAASQPAPAGLALENVAGEIADFADAAGLIAHLDLVISVDTSIAHLAGAMGKPVWTLLPSAADFRWLAGRVDSPWYPTMRLFRQKFGEPWPEVVERIAAELR